jgi:hypothetical protein
MGSTPCIPALNWFVKVVSMEAKITSLKVIWKHVRVISQQPSHVTFSSRPVRYGGR